MRRALDLFLQFRFGHVLHQRAQVVDAVVNKTHVCGERAIAAAIALRGFFDDADARLSIQRSQRGATSGVAGADD